MNAVDSPMCVRTDGVTIDDVDVRVKGMRTPGRPDGSGVRPESELGPPPRLYRQREGRLLGGVSGGIAEHLDVSVLWVRAFFAASAAFGGAGAVAYGLLWVFVRQDGGRGRSASLKERQQSIGLILLGIGLTVAVSSYGWLPAWLTGPLGVTLVGVAVVWREADESQRRRWRQNGVAGVLFSGSTRAGVIRILAGSSLVVIGLSVFLGGIGSVGELQFALLAVLATLVGVAVLTIPWWLRLVRDLDSERASRIRSQERAEIAAHLHDSVLQTLALIQKQSESAREVKRLARGQERELRTWLYGPDGYGRTESGGNEVDRVSQEVLAATLSAELSRACGEVEDSFAVEVQQVVVGDCDVDERIAALLAAAREAVVNAAKHAEVAAVSVYAEVEPEQVSVYVRDRGVGFDLDEVSADRHGLVDSIRGRMERNGGRSRLRSTPGEGTEVQMEMPRAGRP
ncbi:PspC domain-containing protein [Parasphingorhabdus pacifica]